MWKPKTVTQILNFIKMCIQFNKNGHQNKTFRRQNKTFSFLQNFVTKISKSPISYKIRFQIKILI